MNFRGNFNLMTSVRLVSRRLVQIVAMPVNQAYRRMRRSLGSRGLASAVSNDVRNGVKKLFAPKEPSLKDYVALPRYYVSKKLILVLVILMILLPVIFLRFVYPAVQQHFLTRTMYINTEEMYGYTGKVKILSRDADQVLYKGQMENGRITGDGILYDYSGNLIYQGGFLMEMYEGKGELFYPEGVTKYKGEFASNLYEGNGILYNRDGSRLYEGEFSTGRYNGSGTLYYTCGQVQYSGSFAEGHPDGTGSLYSADGVLVYEGDLKSGKFNGNGKLYQNGAILYEGSFEDGAMSGTGTVYSGKNIQYEGEFSANRYNGTGRLYDIVTTNLIYDGEFVDGKYCGQGKLFDRNTGALIYEGTFYDGVYEGEGTLYDPATGYPVYSGGMRQGLYDGTGTEYSTVNGAKIYEGEFLLGYRHGEGCSYMEYTGTEYDRGYYRLNEFVGSSEPEDDGTITLPDGTVVDADGNIIQDPDKAPDNSGNSGTEDPDNSGGGTTAPPTDNPGGSSGGTDTDPDISGGGTAGGDASGGGVTYSGPETADNTIDYSSLAAVSTLKEAQSYFSGESSEWELAAGTSVVYEDQSTGMGLTLQSDEKGSLTGVDVWNDAVLENGIYAGMTKEQLTAALGNPVSETTEEMGESRLVSVSQSNRFNSRLTNLSAESYVTVVTYKTETDTIRAIFMKGIDSSLLLEIR